MSDQTELLELERQITRLELDKSPLTFALNISRNYGEPWEDYAHLKLLNEKVMQLLDGTLGKKRLMVTMPPRHGKSEYCSKYLPAWFLNKYPDKRVILSSYGDDFAAEWGRKVRDIFDNNPDRLSNKIRKDSSAANRWGIDGKQGGMVTAGVGGQLTGRGAHLFIIDDPVKDAVEANSAADRDRKWDWWRQVAQTRLEPGGVVLVIQCMTGDTPVLMADGSETPLARIRPGDRIATYEAGSLSTSTVVNWCNQGPDNIYRVRMESGRVVRANARHPFRVVRPDGTDEWVRLESLRVGMSVRSHEAPTQGSNVPWKDASPPLNARACACRTTERCGGQLDTALHPRVMLGAGKPASRVGTGSRSRTTTVSWPIRMVGAPSVAICRQRSIGPSIGPMSFVSTMTTTREPCEVCSAMTATSSLGAVSIPSRDSKPPLSTWKCGVDRVVEIVPAGVADVFDIEVERTHNFIANGLEVSNTRWHEDDLAGRILLHEGELWEHINLAALAEEDDDLGRRPGEALCPERYDEQALGAIRTSIGSQAWTALYQQRPTPEGGGAFKRKDFRYWNAYPSEEKTYVLNDDDGSLLVPQAECWRFITADLAMTKRTSADYSVAAVWDVAPWLEPSRLILVALERERYEGAEHVEWLEGMWRKYRPSFVGVEKAMQGSMTMAFLQRRGVLVRPLEHKSQDKPFRAKDAELLVENHRVYFPRKADWLAAFEHELLLFPNGTHDDQVDVVAYAAKEILRGINILGKKPKPPERDSIEDKCWKQLRGRREHIHPVLGRIT